MEKRQKKKRLLVFRWCCWTGNSQGLLLSITCISFRREKNTRRRNHSTVPAEEQISHNSGLHLNWMNKKKEPQRVCLKEPYSFEFVVCFSAHETNRATLLTSRHQTLLGFKTFCVSSSCAFPATRQFKGTTTAKHRRQGGEKRQRQHKFDPKLFTCQSNIWSKPPGGSSLPDLINYSPQFSFPFWQPDNPPQKYIFNQNGKQFTEVELW